MEVKLSNEVVVALNELMAVLYKEGKRLEAIKVDGQEIPIEELQPHSLSYTLNTSGES